MTQWLIDSTQLRGIMALKHPLKDTTQPNLLEDTFDYSLPPLIKFDRNPVVEYIDGKPIEFDFNSVKSRDIFITDTTFRDGQQARPPYTVDQMVKVYDMLARLGGPNGVIRLTELSSTAPPELAVKVRLCDTMAFGISYPNVPLPRSIPKLIYKLNKECGVPGSRLEWHGHNDFHKVHVNGATAWLYGCDALN